MVDVSFLSSILAELKRIILGFCVEENCGWFSEQASERGLIQSFSVNLCKALLLLNDTAAALLREKLGGAGHQSHHHWIEFHQDFVAMQLKSCKAISKIAMQFDKLKFSAMSIKTMQ